MKKIYVLDENNQLQEIHAGVDSYDELLNQPINTSYQNTILSADNNERSIIEFCETHEDGRYYITTELNGQETLIIDSSIPERGRRYRRITLDQDFVYDASTDTWITISDTSAKALVFNITNMNEIPSSTVVGNRIILNCYYYSTISNGTITITKVDGNGNTIKTVAVRSLQIGQTTTIDLSNEIADGLNNFRYTVSNNGIGNLAKYSIGNFAITGIQLNYRPTFSPLNMVINENVSFPITFSGTGTKYVHFDIINSNGEVTSYDDATPLVNDSSNTLTIPSSYFSHGANTITSYMFMLNAAGTDKLTQTDPVSYNFPFVVNENEPIVMTYFDFTTLQEWDTKNIPYYIWSASTSAVEKVRFKLFYSQTDPLTEETIYDVILQEYDNSTEADINKYLTTNKSHNWQVSNAPYGTLNFQIFLNDNEEPSYEYLNLEIEKGEYDFSTISDYLFNFSPLNISDDKGFNEWTSKQATMRLSGFNWTTDGMITEVDKSLHFSTSATTDMEDPHNLFSYAAGAANGMSVEFDFKVDSNAIDTEPVITYTELGGSSNHGIFIYPTKAIINYNLDSNTTGIEIDYQKGERIQVAVAIDAINNLASHRFLRVYINGILSHVTQYSAVTRFATNCNYFKFNASNNEFDLYGFRAYSRVLNSREVLQNFTSNFASTDTKREMLIFNNIYYSQNDNRETKYHILDENGDPTGEEYTISGEYDVSFRKTLGKIGVLVVVSPSLPVTKDYIKKISTIYYEKGMTSYISETAPDNPQIQWDPNNHCSMATTYNVPATSGKPKRSGKLPKFGAQGTSSLEYPRKNFKFKFEDKFYIKGHTDGADKTFTMKADYMDSSGANNISNAQIMENGLIRDDWAGTPVNDGKRLNLDGFPICMFWATGVDNDGNPYTTDYNGNIIDPEFIGTFNFNYDKKAKSLLGWEDEPYQFQGFEFRDNTSDICLEKSISGMRGFKNSNIGFEWRWSKLTDLIDDYHDGNLENTIDGGYFDGDVTQYTEQQYIQQRKNNSDIGILVPYNRFYIGDDQLVIKQEDNTYKPFNYNTIGPDRDVFNIEYGVKIDNGALYWQLPYGIEYVYDSEIEEGKTREEYLYELGKSYPSGEGYYKYTRNPDHKCLFEYNDAEPYFYNTNLTYTKVVDGENVEVPVWNKIYDLADKVYKHHIEYIEDVNGDYVFDNDGEYHPFEYYSTEEQSEFTTKYNRIDTYIQVTDEDATALRHTDLMEDIFANWYYVVDTIVHSDDQSFLSLIDSRKTYSDGLGNNGNGLFIFPAVLNYYCLSLITGLCDNFSKNMFVHSYDNGKTWVPAWYDMDTCFGLNNTGKYVFDYDVNFKDPGVFNGSNSKLWDGVYRLAMNDIVSKYRQIRATQISYNQIMNVLYDGNIKFKGEAMYNASAFYRYILPYLSNMSGTQLMAAQGSRLPLLKYWNSNRQTFLDSIYGSNLYTEDKIIMRMYSPKTFTFHLTPDTNMQLGFAFNQSDASMPDRRSGKILANQTWDYEYTVTAPLQDLNTYIYGASHLVDVGDLSYTVPKSVDLTKATKLRSIIFGTDDPDLLARYDSAVASQGFELQLPNAVCKNVKRIDLHNLKYLNFKGDQQSLVLVKVEGGKIINKFPALQYLDVRGSNISSITLGDYTPVEYIGFSDQMTTINLNNLLRLSRIELSAINPINSITVSNCPLLDQLSIVKSLENSSTIFNMDNINGTDDNRVTMSFMDWLAGKANVLKGTIYVEAVGNEMLDKYRAKWPNLNIEWHQIFEDDAVLGVTGVGLSNILTATYGSRGKRAEVINTDDLIVLNDYDELFPYNEMSYQTDEYGNKFVRIPKFYTYFGEDNNMIRDVRISRYKIGEDWFLNPCFIRSDGSERDYIEIATYLCNDTIESKSGTIAVEKTKTGWNTAINNKYGNNDNYYYSMETPHTRQLLEVLFLIEFKNSNSLQVMNGFYTWSQIENGQTDFAISKSDVPASASNNIQALTNQSTAMSYRGIENAWGGGPVWMDGGYTINKRYYLSTQNYGQPNENFLDTGVNIIESNGDILAQLNSESITMDGNNFCYMVPSAVGGSLFSDAIYNEQNTNIRYLVCNGPVAQQSEAISYGIFFRIYSRNATNSGKARLVRYSK